MTQTLETQISEKVVKPAIALWVAQLSVTPQARMHLFYKPSTKNEFGQIAISAKKPDSDWQEAWMDAIEPTCSHKDAHDLVFRRAGKLPLLPTNGNARLDDYPTPQGADVTEYARSIGYKGKRKVFVSDELVISHNRIEWSDFCENCRESAVSLA
jgi:hypothetical protein